MTTKAHRYHDISVGHRVVGHEGKCRFLHGHNYRVHFEVEADALDSIGRVMDFSVIKERLCLWLEDNWDHKFLAWGNDPIIRVLMPTCKPGGTISEFFKILNDSIVWVPFNPTAENMALHLVQVVGPLRLKDTGCVLTKVVIEETRKCSCSYSIYKDAT